MKKTICFVLFFVSLASTVMQFSGKASASEHINIWWPTDSAVVSGTQPFKAVIDGKPIEQYQIYWSVDNGQHNWMDTSYTDWPHKEAQVDVSGWSWKDRGPYAVTFIAKDWQGTTLGQRTITINVQHSASPPQDPSVTASQTPVPSAEPTPTPASGGSPERSSPVTTTSYSLPTSVEQANAYLYVDPDSQAQKSYLSLLGSRPHDANLIYKIASQPQAKWFGGWNTDIYTDVYAYTWNAQVTGKTPVMVLYNIPNRDCGGYSQGGTASIDQYRKWITNVANGLNGSPIIILEPDSLALTDCLSSSGKEERYGMLREAITILSGKGAKVYLDAGHPNWVAPHEMAQRLKNAGVGQAQGFALNTSNFIPTEENITYGNTISGQTGGKRFVIDTSRNGGGASGTEWCNPSGRSLGRQPTLSTGIDLVDAYLWIKRPGESDGNCNGGPNAGEWWTDYALGLAKRAAY